MSAHSDHPAPSAEARSDLRASGRARPSTAFVRGLFPLLTLLALGCNSGEESRTEARALLDRLNKLKADGSLTQRKQALDSLELFSLHDPKHLRVRDLCRNAHLQLLDAEAAQVGARKALEEATRSQQPGGGSLTAERGQTIAAELERSNAALVAARREFPKCEEATVALAREAR